MSKNQTQEIQLLKKELKDTVSKIREMMLNDKLNILKNPEHKNLWEKMVSQAIYLHKAADPPPKHHKYMITNRGVEPDNPDFYNHIHPVEDLIAFIDDPHANDDPEDVTLNAKFNFVVHSPRWDSDNHYILTRNKDGWLVQFSNTQQCDFGCRPYLYESLSNDSIEYPAQLKYYFEWLWDQAEKKGLSVQEVQDALVELQNWVNSCVKSSPTSSIWDGYK